MSEQRAGSAGPRQLVEVRRSNRRKRTVTAYRERDTIVVLLPGRMSVREEREWVDRRIFPDAMSRTIVGKAMSRFSGAQRWVAVLIVVLIAYTVLAHIAWNRASADLRDVTSRVEFTNRDQ